jgi:hypothetical protein
MGIYAIMGQAILFALHILTEAETTSILLFI